MKQYKGNRYPFCCALFTEADAAEAVGVIETLVRQKIRCAVPKRRCADCIARAAVVLLFLSPEAICDKTILKSITEACAAGKTILTVYLKETHLTPGLAMQLNQMQAVLRFREDSDEAFYEKLLNAPALKEMSVTPQQKKALRRHTLGWAIGGILLLLAGVLLGLYWRPLKAMLPTSPLRKLGVPLDLDGIEMLYVYGESRSDAYVMPRYRIAPDGEQDLAWIGDQRIPQGDITKVDDFAMLKNLKELCLCNNPVESFEPITALTQLTLLDVSHDGLSNLDGIGALSALETLNVSHNTISELGEITKLSKLRTLNISYTEVSSLNSLASMPSLETVYIDAMLLDAADALGETSFAIICLDTPVYKYADLAEALNDPLVTDIRVMRSMIVPYGEELRIRPDVDIYARSNLLDVSVYGTVIVEGVWELDYTLFLYGTVVIENGGICFSRSAYTVNAGTFRVEQGGRYNMGYGETFTFTGGYYENNGDVYLKDAYRFRFLSGSIVNNGALHLRAADFYANEVNIPTDEIVNNGVVYLDRIPVLDGTPFSGMRE